MTFTDILTVTGSAAGLAVLLAMALAPSLIDLPLRRRRVAAEVAVPHPRGPADQLVRAA